MQDQNQNQTEYPEVDLRAYARMIMRHWPILIISAAALAVIAAAASLSTPKKYKSEMVLDLGNVIQDQAVLPESGEIKNNFDAQEIIVYRGIGAAKKNSQIPIESGSQIREKNSNGIYAAIVREKIGVEKDDYPLVKVFGGDMTSFVFFSAESKDPKLAADVLRETGSTIIDLQKPLLEKSSAAMTRRAASKKGEIEAIRQKIKAINEEKNINSEKLAAINKLIVSGQGANMEAILIQAQDRQMMLIQQAEFYGNEISQKEIELGDIEEKIKLIKPTKVVAEPKVSKTALSQNTDIYAVFGAIIGFIFGFFAIVVADWWRGVPERKN